MAQNNYIMEHTISRRLVKEKGGRDKRPPFLLLINCAPLSVGFEFGDGAEYVFGLGEDVVFELGGVGDEGVEGGDAADGCVEVFEQFVADARGDLRAEAVRARVFVGDDDAARFLDRCHNRFPVVGRERAEVYDFDAGALRFGLLGGDDGALDERAVGDDREVCAFAHGLGLAEGDEKVVGRILRFVVRLSVEMFVFEEEHGIVRADRRA